MLFSILSGFVAVTVVAMLLNRNGTRPITLILWLGFAAIELTARVLIA